MMAAFTWRQAPVSRLTTKRKATGSISANSSRLNRDQFPFMVGGSKKDPFEPRQVDLAEERLIKLGLQVERLPGGHLTTNEQPEALAGLVTKFERGLQE